MRIQCTSCGEVYEIDDSYANRKVECECGNKWIAQNTTPCLVDQSGLFLSAQSQKTADEKQQTIPEDIDQKEDIDPRFANVRFASVPPTLLQFIYAVRLGINVNKKSFSSISTAIEKAKEKKPKRQMLDLCDEDLEEIYEYICDQSPASREQLRYIKELHGELSRNITSGEADSIIEYLEDFEYVCPFCGEHVATFEEECLFCGRSQRSVRIPIHIEKCLSYQKQQEELEIEAPAPSSSCSVTTMQAKKNPVHKHKKDPAVGAVGCFVIVVILFFILSSC